MSVSLCVGNDKGIQCTLAWVFHFLFSLLYEMRFFSFSIFQGYWLLLCICKSNLCQSYTQQTKFCSLFKKADSTFVQWLLSQFLKVAFLGKRELCFLFNDINMKSLPSCFKFYIPIWRRLPDNLKKYELHDFFHELYNTGANFCLQEGRIHGAFYLLLKEENRQIIT